MNGVSINIRQKIQEISPQKRETFISAAKVSILVIWGAQLLFGLASIIKSRNENTKMTYVAAFMSGLSFFLYIGCGCLESAESGSLKKRLENLETNFNAAEARITSLEKVVKKSAGKDPTEHQI